jgi:acetyl esterase/lipase
MNYRMADEALFPAAVQDVKAAIRFLRAHAAEYDLDAERVAVWGNSAGAYLAVMAGVTGNNADFDDPALGNAAWPSNVQAVIDWFGPIDFISMDDQLRASGKGRPEHGEASSPESRFIGMRLGDAGPALLRKTNPLTYLAPGLPPFLIQHGDNDDLVPIEQSFLLAEQLRAVLPPGDVRLDVLQGSLHGGPAFDLPGNLAKVLSFLAAALAAPS